MPVNKPKAESVQSLSVNKTIAVAALGSLTVVLVSAFVIKALLSSIGFYGRVISKKDAANKQLKSNYEAAKTLASQYAELGSKLQLINDALPTSPDFPAIVATSEAVAGSSGVHLKSVTAANSNGTVVNKTETPQPFNFNISVSGSYDNLLKFFANLELASRPMKILSITQTGSSPAQSAEIKLQTYYQTAVDTSPKTEEVK